MDPLRGGVNGGAPIGLNSIDLGVIAHGGAST